MLRIVKTLVVWMTATSLTLFTPVVDVTPVETDAGNYVMNFFDAELEIAYGDAAAVVQGIPVVKRRAGGFGGRKSSRASKPKPKKSPAQLKRERLAKEKRQREVAAKQKQDRIASRQQQKASGNYRGASGNRNYQRQPDRVYVERGGFLNSATNIMLIWFLADQLFSSGAEQHQIREAEYCIEAELAKEPTSAECAGIIEKARQLQDEGKIPPVEEIDTEQNWVAMQNDIQDKQTDYSGLISGLIFIGLVIGAVILLVLLLRRRKEAKYA